jgi:hypothetical protein
VQHGTNEKWYNGADVGDSKKMSFCGAFSTGMKNGMGVYELREFALKGINLPFR